MSHSIKLSFYNMGMPGRQPKFFVDTINPANHGTTVILTVQPRRRRSLQRLPHPRDLLREAIVFNAPTHIQDFLRDWVQQMSA